jgi:hypothetical protein
MGITCVGEACAEDVKSMENFIVGKHAPEVRCYVRNGGGKTSGVFPKARRPEAEGR